MTTSEFLNLLQENPERELLLEYQKGQFVPKAYHITEVKKLHFDSVDCGGKEYSEEQTVVQIWVSPLERKRKFMATEKALEIMERVHQIRPLQQDAELLFEYGNKNLLTSNYTVQKVVVEEGRLILKLFVPATSCKPLQMSNLKKAASACCGKAMSCC